MRRNDLLSGKSFDFKKKIFGGYNPQEVEEYISRIETSYRELEEKHNHERQKYFQEKEQLENEIAVLREELNQQDTMMEESFKEYEKEILTLKQNYEYLKNSKEDKETIFTDEMIHAYFEEFSKDLQAMYIKVENRIKIDDYLLERYHKQKDLEKTLMNLQKSLYKLQELSKDQELQETYPSLKANLRSVFPAK